MRSLYRNPQGLAKRKSAFSCIPCLPWVLLVCLQSALVPGDACAGRSACVTSADAPDRAKMALSGPSMVISRLSMPIS